MTKQALLSKSDIILESIIFQLPEPSIVSTKNVFNDLMSCIIEQQIHYRSTKKIFEKMLAASNLEYLTIDNFYQFEEKSFGNIKLANYKYETIHHIVSFWETNAVDWFLLTDEEVISKLSTIKGIGKWTIDMIMMYTLERTNVFPFDDFHLKQIMTKVYNLNPNIKLKAQMVSISETWGAHKSLAALYLLAWKKHIK